MSVGTDAGESVQDSGEITATVLHLATVRRQLGGAASEAMSKLRDLLETQRRLPEEIRQQETESAHLQNEFGTVDTSLFEAVNGALLSGAVGTEEALEYFDVLEEDDRLARCAAYERIVNKLQKAQEAAGDGHRAKLVVADAKNGLVWGRLRDDVAPYVMYREGEVVLGASIELERGKDKISPAVVPPNAGVGDGVLSAEEIAAYTLGHKPFKGGGSDSSFDPDELILAGRGLDALKFLGAEANKQDARYLRMQHGIGDIIKLRTNDNGGLELTRFIVPAVNGNRETVAAALKVMKRHFPDEYKALKKNLAMCMAHEPDHVVKSGGLYNAPVALDFAAVMTYGPNYTQTERMDAGMKVVKKGEKLLREKGAQ